MWSVIWCTAAASRWWRCTVSSCSQSSVSRHVRRLEKTLGRPVVERDDRKTRLTNDAAHPVPRL
ncbi:LysR family transcriptional regulator [Streptomyces albogriseolus]|uniref:LysR family transcriptional regulator n=1 Tax=Streptomyces albogriseolus TaxID=1887 RepID=UPI0037B6264F